MIGFQRFNFKLYSLGCNFVQLENESADVEELLKDLMQTNQEMFSDQIANLFHSLAKFQIFGLNYWQTPDGFWCA